MSDAFKGKPTRRAQPSTGERLLPHAESDPPGDLLGGVSELPRHDPAIDEFTLSTREQRLALLVEVGDLLGASLCYETTLRDLADLMVPRFADWCAVDIANDAGELERLAAAHVQPEKRRIAQILQERYPRLHGARGSEAVFQTGRPQWARDIPDEWLVAATSDPEQLAMIRDLGLRSYVSVPLAARGSVLGVLTLIHAESGRLFDEEDLTFALAVASRAAVAIDNARLYQLAQRELDSRRAAERQAAERAGDARRRLDELRALMDLVPVGIAVTRDIRAEEISVNNEAAAMFGIERNRNASKSAADAAELPFRVLRDGREVPPGDLPMQWALANNAEVRGEEFEIVRADGRTVTLMESATPLRDDGGTVRGCIGVFTDITRRRESERLLQARARRLEAIEAMVRPGLSGESLQVLLDTAVQRIARATEAELCGVLELQADGRTMRLRAGIGWERGLVGVTTVSADSGTQAGYTLNSPLPWIMVDDLAREARFPRSTLLDGHGICGSVSVRIGAGEDEPFGVLIIGTRMRRYFPEEECRFLRSAADTLSNLLRGRRALAAARESHDQLDFTLDAANLGTWEWHIDTGEVIWSDRLLSIHGRKPGEFHGTVESAFSDAHPDDRESVSGAIAHSLETDAPYRVEYRILTTDGHTRWVEGRGRVIRDAEGRPRRFHGVCMDITARKQLESELQHAASHDPLTGLPNRALFIDRLQHMIERNTRESVDYAVLLLDLDDFKQVNDNLGHLAGDALLVQFTERVKSCLRPGDTFARLGGDEFVMLLEEENGQVGMQAVAQRILDQTERPFEIEGRRVQIGVSIGGMLGVSGCRRPQDVLREADLALYEAKNQGKGCIHYLSLTG
jgi:diguanylate cyclase (GGDEF)-like protein/PAS domain S-box-containing protein